MAFDVEKLNVPELPLSGSAGILICGGKPISVVNLAIGFSEQGLLVITGQLPDDFPATDEGILTFTSSSGWNVHVERFLLGKRSIPSGGFEASAPSAIAVVGNLEANSTTTWYELVAGLQFQSRSPNEDAIRFTPHALTDVTLREARFPYLPSVSGVFECTGSLKDLNVRRKELLNELYNLLSFLASNFIAFPIAIFAGDQGTQVELRSHGRETGRGKSFLLDSLPTHIDIFINSTFDSYRAYRASLNLPVLIHYYVLLKNTQYAETRYLIGAILMEALKYYFALNVKRYHKNQDGFFIKGKSSKGRTEIYGFRELIEQVFAHFGITQYSTKFIDYRNIVIHQGQLGLAATTLVQEEQEFEELIEKTLLKILGYQGAYWDRSAQFWAEFSTMKH